MQLTWRDGEKSDRSRLTRFECTTEFRRTRSNRHEQHPLFWEHEVQSWFRKNAKPPRRHPAYLLVGLLGDDIKAAAAWRQVDGPLEVELQFMAVSRDCRGTGVADDLMSRTLHELASALDASGTITIATSAYQENHASRRLLERFNFECLDDTTTVHLWGRLLPVDISEKASRRSM